MINNQYPSYLYNSISRYSILLAILCFSLISCAIPKKNSQDEVKQVQSEQKPLDVHEKNKGAGDKTKQSAPPSLVKNKIEKKLPQNVQHETNADNYSSEIQSTQTPEEKSAQLEDKLDTSLRDFDEMLLKKNQELSVPSQMEESQGGNGLASQRYGQGQEQGQGESSQDKNSSDSSTGGGASRQSNTGTMSQNKDFDNDDVVARQIREAAEKETDPVLKKKLWEEYRKYKGGSN